MAEDGVELYFLQCKRHDDGLGWTTLGAFEDPARAQAACEASLEEEVRHLRMEGLPVNPGSFATRVISGSDLRAQDGDVALNVAEERTWVQRELIRIRSLSGR